LPASIAHIRPAAPPPRTTTSNASGEDVRGREGIERASEFAPLRGQLP
jgi:hypothetical protein